MVLVINVLPLTVTKIHSSVRSLIFACADSFLAVNLSAGQRGEYFAFDSGCISDYI